MNDLLNLSDEVLLGICEEMDDVGLMNFVQSSSRGYNVCSEILSRRKVKKLALALQDRHIGMPVNIFNQIIKDNTGLINLIIKNLELFNDGLFLDSDDEEIYGGLGVFKYDLPVVPKIHIDPDHRYTTNHLEFRTYHTLNEVEKQYFRTVIDFMMKPTKYVVGINTNGSLKIIEIPFNSDFVNLTVSITNNDYFNDYLGANCQVYSNMMSIRYL